MSDEQPVPAYDVAGVVERIQTTPVEGVPVAGWLASVFSQPDSREIGHGVWQHTFTPAEPVEQHGFTLSDLDAFIGKMYERADPHPWTFMMSPAMHKRIARLERVSRLYAAHPLPRRTLRKCIRRRIVRARQAGMRRIRKREAREAWEEAAIVSKDKER